MFLGVKVKSFVFQGVTLLKVDFYKLACFVIMYEKLKVAALDISSRQKHLFTAPSGGGIIMMRRLARVHKDSQGFTLVELMIVVAIIGILAAIAIPQFAAYRIRGFNASAQSDLRNANTLEGAFFADWQIYGVTAIAPVAGGGLGALLTGPGGAATLISGAAGARANAVPAVAGTNQSLQVGLGNNVSMVVNTNAAAAPATEANTTFVGASKHLQGDSIFGVDSDTTVTYKATLAAYPAGTILANAAATIPQAPTAADNYATVANFVAQ